MLRDQIKRGVSGAITRIHQVRGFVTVTQTYETMYMYALVYLDFHHKIYWSQNWWYFQLKLINSINKMI